MGEGGRICVPWEKAWFGEGKPKDAGKKKKSLLGFPSALVLQAGPPFERAKISAEKK